MRLCIHYIATIGRELFYLACIFTSALLSPNKSFVNLNDIGRERSRTANHESAISTHTERRHRRSTISTIMVAATKHLEGIELVLSAIFQRDGFDGVDVDVRSFQGRWSNVLSREGAATGN